MKKIVKYLSAAWLILGCLMGVAACDDYEECPPLNEGYLTTYIMPPGVFLNDAEWEEVDSEADEYEAFLEAAAAAPASAE